MPSSWAANKYMKTEIDKYYHLQPDEKAGIGASYCESIGVSFSLFDNKQIDFNLDKPIEFQIKPGKFEGTIGDFQINDTGFLLFSEKLTSILSSFLTEIDLPKWFPAIVTDLNGKSYPYSILHFFKHNDLLDRKLTTYSDWLKRHPVKLRFDINKIGERKIFSMKFETTLYIHEEVKKAIVKAKCQGIYFYGIHKPGRLSP
jgi:hypothetical protein